MGITTSYKFEVEESDRKKVIKEFLDILKILNCSYKFSFYYFLKDFEVAKTLFKKINSVYSENFIVEIEASENIENSVANNISKKYFDIVKEFNIAQSYLYLYSLNKKDLEENVKPCQSISFRMNSYWKPTVGFSCGFKSKINVRMKFFQECIAALGVEGEVKEGPGDFGNIGLRVSLKPEEKRAALKVMGSDTVGDVDVNLTPTSHKLEDAIQLFDKLLQKDLFPVRSYNFSMGAGIEKLSTLVKKFEIPVGSIGGDYLGWDFDIKIIDVLREVGNIDGLIGVSTPFDFGEIDRGYGYIKLYLKGNSTEIEISTGSYNHETIIKYISKKTNKKINYVDSF